MSKSRIPERHIEVLQESPDQSRIIEYLATLALSSHLRGDKARLGQVLMAARGVLVEDNYEQAAKLMVAEAEEHREFADDLNAFAAFADGFQRPEGASVYRARSADMLARACDLEHLASVATGQSVSADEVFRGPSAPEEQQ